MKNMNNSAGKGDDMGERDLLKEVQVSWSEFSNAVEVFGKDYGIVGHDADPLVGFFDVPREHGNYSLVGINGMSETEFRTRLKEKPVVLLVGCMDRRGAKMTHDLVKEQEVEDSDSLQMVTLTVGGGIIARDTVTRNGREVEVGRGKAMQTILKFIAENADVRKVVATDHDCRCGAEAFAADDQGWPEQLECELGAQEEQQKMSELIKDFGQRLLPQQWFESGIVDLALVHFEGDPESSDYQVRLIAV